MPAPKPHCSIAGRGLLRRSTTRQAVARSCAKGTCVNARWIWWVVVVVAGVWSLAGRADAAPGEAQNGKAHYERLCVSCHGPNGAGGRMAGMLPVRPRNLTEAAYMRGRSDQQLFDVIHKGGAAVGLSDSMTAFGSQLTEAQTWDVVAYVRTLAAEAPTRLSATEAFPLRTDLTMARLRLSIWPEYDDPRVLVMLRGELTPRQAFPARIVLPIPKGAEIIGAGMISDQEELLLHPHKVVPGEAQDSLELQLPVPRFFVEFYYAPFPGTDSARRFAYAAPTTYPITVFEVDIQQPLQATGFVVEPAPMERSTDDKGFTYHQFVAHNVDPGQNLTYTIAYTKASNTPSVPKQTPAPQPSTAAKPPPAPTTSPRVISLALLGGAVLLFVGWAWLTRASRAQTPVPTTSAPAGSLTETFLALIQAEEQPADTVPQSAGPTPEPPVHFCTQCGRKLAPEDRFCAGCGKAIQR